MAQYVKNSINFHGARSKTVSNEEETSKKLKKGKKKRHDSSNSNSKDANINWGMSNGNSASTANLGYDSWDSGPADNTWVNQNKKPETNGWGSRRPEKKDSFWDNIDQEFPPIAAEKPSQKNVWKEREKKFEEIKYLQPTTEDEEEKMLRLALELSKTEVNVNGDIRKRLEDEFQLQQEMLKNNPGEFQDFILSDECAAATGWKSAPSEETASASLKTEWDADDYICPSNSSSKHKDLDRRNKNYDTAENLKASKDSDNWDNYKANHKQSYEDDWVTNSNKNKNFKKSHSKKDDDGTKRIKQFSSNRKEDGLWDNIEDDSLKNQTPKFENKFHNSIKACTKEDTNSRINKVVSMFGGWGGSSNLSNIENNNISNETFRNTDYKADVCSAPDKKKAISHNKSNKSDVKKSSSGNSVKVNQAHINSTSNISTNSALTSDNDVFYDAIEDNIKNLKTENNISDLGMLPGNPTHKNKEEENVAEAITTKSSNLSENTEIILGNSEQEEYDKKTVNKIEDSVQEISFQDTSFSNFKENTSQNIFNSQNDALINKQAHISQYFDNHSDNFQTSKIEDSVQDSSAQDTSLSNFNENTSQNIDNNHSENFQAEITPDYFRNPDPFKEAESDAIIFIEPPKPATTLEYYPEQLGQNNSDFELNAAAIKTPGATEMSDFIEAPKPSAHVSESALNFNSSETVDQKTESMPQFPSMGMPNVPFLPVNPMMGMFMNPAMMAGMNPMLMQHMMMLGSPFIANQLMTMDMYYRSLGMTPGLPQMFPPHMLGMHPTFLGQTQPEPVSGQSNIESNANIENTTFDNLAENMNLHKASSASVDPTGNVFGSNNFINSPVMPENSFESSSFNSSANIHINQPTINVPIPAPKNAQIDTMCSSYGSNLPSVDAVIPEKQQTETLNPSDFDDSWLMSYLSNDKKELSIPPPVQPLSKVSPEVPSVSLTIGAECNAVSHDKKPAFSSNSVCDKNNANASFAKPVATGWGDIDDDGPSKTNFNDDLDGWGNDNYTVKSMGNSSRQDSSKKNMTRQPSRQPNVHRFRR